MIRNLYIAVTVLFWLIVLGFRLGSICSPQAAQPTTDAMGRVISASELARHANAEDCWMAIRGSVYDLTSYLPDHPSTPDIIERWCGKEATAAYNTKTKGRPHSPAADALLAKYRLGQFSP